MVRVRVMCSITVVHIFSVAWPQTWGLVFSEQQNVALSCETEQAFSCSVSFRSVRLIFYLFNSIDICSLHSFLTCEMNCSVLCRLHISRCCLCISECGDRTKLLRHHINMWITWPYRSTRLEVGCCQQSCVPFFFWCPVFAYGYGFLSYTTESLAFVSFVYSRELSGVPLWGQWYSTVRNTA